MDNKKDWVGSNHSSFVQLGASNHTEHDRETHDFYATDPAALRLFARHYAIPHHVWEPSCGLGHLSEELVRLGHCVTSTDLVNRGYGKGGVDFFSQNEALGESATADYCILTNPPYRYANEYVIHALNLLKEHQQLILFLKTTFLESSSRFEAIFKNTPPDLYISTLSVCSVR